MERYDYIIAGAGAAGLNMAYHLLQAGLLDQQSLLLIDQAPKTANDRTWCFWEVGDNVFEPIVFRRWRQVAFHGEGFSRALDLSPYCYKMIRGEDFYRFMDQALAARSSIARRYGRVERIAEDETGAQVVVDGKAYRGAWVFNSIAAASPRPTPVAAADGVYHTLLQHFAGWVVSTPAPIFDPSAATLMDFRIPQRGECRFCYVLPFDAQRALVEFTVFSPRLLARDAYDREIEAYLRDFLGAARYEIEHEEFGVIPMTDAPFQTFPGRRVVNIGIAGGCAKPSTGYTFLRIQQQAQRITHALKTTGQPRYTVSPFQRRFGLYDSVLLNILDKQRYPGRNVFTDLFARNPIARVLKFLDETTSLIEDAGVLTSTWFPPFVAATLDVTLGRLWRRLRAPAS